MPIADGHDYFTNATSVVFTKMTRRSDADQSSIDRRPDADPRRSVVFSKKNLQIQDLNDYQDSK